MGALAQRERRLRLGYKPKTGFGSRPGRPAEAAGYPNDLG